jgi:DNA-binding CsgD family transcriptional regulator
MPELTERQIAILRLLADGFSTDQIAVEIGISRNTVRYHIRMILTVLKARDRTHAIAIAMRLGILR